MPIKIFLLKWKIWRIEAGLKSLLRKKSIKPFVCSFGAYYIDPKSMVFVAGVSTDIEKKELKVDADFSNSMKSLLAKYNWPKNSREHIIFDIESRETVKRENNGNWWYHYK